MKLLKEVMSKNVTCLGPEVDLSKVAHKMKEIDAGSIPICENDRIIGMVTDRDIVLKTLGSGSDPNSAQARSVMSSPIVYCYEDQDIGEASRVMEVKQIRRLVVLNREKKLVGIVSLGDLYLRGNNDALGKETLGKISEPAAREQSLHFF